MTELRLFAVTSDGPEELVVPPDVHGFDDLYTRVTPGVYSVLRTFGHNRFLHLEAHLARVERSMALLGWSYTLDRQALCRAIDAVVTAVSWPESRVRFDVLPKPAYALGTESHLLIAVQPFTPWPRACYEQGVALGWAEGLHRERPLAKTADFAIRRHSLLLANPHINDYLMRSPEGYILEGTGSNFYGVRDGVVWTAKTGVLEGITRQIILRLLSELGIPVRLQPVHESELAQLSEAAISSSSRGLMPVVRIGDMVIGNGRPGPVCRRIMAAYETYVTQAVKTAVASCQTLETGGNYDTI
ncbi:MAG: hypothetical protein D6706_16890 [Chloroflexi bacterium]|nr:MAG: hypothetical protein D6706_16890 [Chloroflexota bacterium]